MADSIRRWFVEHEDGEFVIPPRDDPYWVVPPLATAPCILYTTKRHSALQLFSDCPQWPCGVIARYGLPDEGDLEWLRSQAAGRPLLFVGDADPPDLLVFAWLRSRMDVEFRGLGDALLERCGVPLEDRCTIAQTPAESAAMPLVTEHLPDLDDLLGPHCAALLHAGRKTELEALVSFATVERAAIADALVE